MTSYRVLERAGALTAGRIAYKDAWRPRWLPRPLWALYVRWMA